MNQKGYTHIVIAILIALMAVGLVGAAWYYEENKEEVITLDNISTEATITKDGEWFIYNKGEVTVRYKQNTKKLSSSSQSEATEKYEYSYPNMPYFSISIPSSWDVDIDTSGETFKISPPKETFYEILQIDPIFNACPHSYIKPDNISKEFIEEFLPSPGPRGVLSWIGDYFELTPIDGIYTSGYEIIYSSDDGSKLYNWCLYTGLEGIHKYIQLTSGSPLNKEFEKIISSVYPSNINTEINLNKEIIANIDATTELPLTVSVENNKLLYARKDGYDVSVFERNIQNGKEELLFKYIESKEGKLTGNYWTDQPPSIALSSDGNKFAYSSENQVAIRSRITGSEQILLKVSSRPDENIEAPPTWSGNADKEGWGIYGFYKPLWSSNQKYLKLVAGHYEGGTHQIVNIEEGKIFSPKNEDEQVVSHQHEGFAWSSTGDQYVIANRPGYARPGLFISRKGDIEIVDELLNLDNPYVFRAVFSPDSTRIAFIYSPEHSYYGIYGAVINSDGNYFLNIVEGTSVMTPIFSEDGGSIYFTVEKDGIKKIIKYELITGISIDILVLPGLYESWEHPYWTYDNYLALEGVSRVSEERNLFLIDPDNRAIVYSSGPQSYFTSFLGFIR